MDLFIIDKLLIAFGKKLMTDTVVQFGTLVGLWIISEIALPSKKKEGQKQ